MRSPGSLSAGAAFAPLRITVRPSLFNVRYWQCDLIECALLGRLVGTPPHQLGAVAEAITGDMIKSNLYHQFRPKRFPFSAAIGTPAARAARCLAGESGQATELLKLSRQRWLLGVGHHRAPPSDLVARSGALGSRSGRYYSANLREWFRARQIGDIKAARKVLEDAARRGDVGAAWKLGRMYADGDEVERSDQRGFEYFRTLADSHAEETPGTAPAVFVAKAFVEIGAYYLTGIANYIKPDAAHAHQLFSYAASYFGDPDAQYRLGRTYLDGQGTAKSPKQAARWLRSAADKGQYKAQAVFGAMLFKGEYVSRDAAQGLMYLMLGSEAASSEETWITDLYAAALKQATADERTRALDLLKRWIEQSHSGR